MNSYFTPADISPALPVHGTGFGGRACVWRQGCYTVGALLCAFTKLLHSAWFLVHNLSREIENLFMVGAGTHPGAGIPGVLMSAKTIEQVVPDVQAFA